ncbi:hypothetical protein HanXRQr2_Chr13g0582171 [Helianthus annuus]|nr:hypothetical protein HanXRQr2_Chr13g0582171 [Helianthus annuus]KAJ0476429.1 hypothetical protein HanHA300_Chr13g0477301 [Helianthus annuus]KAJ0497256.1 hypothetical protein HanHA89_Chr13g0509411 [Helianthus annuus]KAJ0663265.1 hypothetical protein HanLR1_Chr13g0479361 [Helianthus annuus]KAJ0670775.1 hypothetical protein HanOQP8_Chr13g0478371 [Helianthus annuus]
MKSQSKKESLIGNFFKRKYEEINENRVGDDDTSPNEATPPNVDNDNIQANDDVDSSPNVDNDDIQANDDVDASPNVDNDNPTTSIPTTRGIIDLDDLPLDPYDRPPIASYHPNQIDDIRRSYLESFRHTISDDDKFANLNVINDLARVMVETGTHSSCPSVYRVVKLALLLPVATTTIERCFFEIEACQDGFTQWNGLGIFE